MFCLSMAVALYGLHGWSWPWLCVSGQHPEIFFAEQHTGAIPDSCCEQALPLFRSTSACPSLRTTHLLSAQVATITTERGWQNIAARCGRPGAAGGGVAGLCQQTMQGAAVPLHVGLARQNDDLQGAWRGSHGGDRGSIAAEQLQRQQKDSSGHIWILRWRSGQLEPRSRAHTT
jgi:hypothetical protein